MTLEITVPSVIVSGSRIWIVGEAGGRNEEQQHRPFVGQAGRLLDKILAVGGVDRTTVSVTNVVKRAPNGGYDSEHFKETFYETSREIRRTEVASKRCKHCAGTLRQHRAKRRRTACGEFEAGVVVRESLGRKSTRSTEELQMYIDLLRRELSEHRPSVVVAVGGEALKALCGVDGITNYRGSVLDCTLVEGIKVVPILHPAAIMRGALWQEVYIQGRIIADRVVPLAGGRLAVDRPWIEILEPDMNHVITILQPITGPYTLDIETRGGSIACVGIASEVDNREFAICIPIQTTTGPWYSPAEELVVLQEIGRLLQRNPNLIGQNLTYDLEYLLDYGIVPSGVLLDTMLAFHVLYAELPKGLDFLTMRYTTIPYYKEEGKTWGSRTPDEDLWRYNIKDCIATLRVGKLLLEELRPIGEYFYGYFMKLFPIALEMQRLGMEVDMGELQSIRGVIQQEIQRIHTEIVGKCGYDLNVGSPAQVAKYLYGELKLPAKKKRGRGTVTTDEDALMELLAKFPQSRELKLVMAERHLRKSLESYIDVPLERV